MVEIIRLMSFCNNSCIHCMVDSEIKNYEEKNLNYYLSKIDLNKSSNINLFGGEPTIHPYFLKILKYSHIKNISITISSNCKMMYYELFTKKLKDYNVKAVLCSLYSHEKNIHEKITGSKESFYYTVEGIKNLIKYNIPVEINVVITKLNYQILEEILLFLKKLGVSKVRFSGLLIKGSAQKNRDILILSKEEIKDTLIRGINVAKELNIDFLIEKIPICFMPTFFDNFVIEIPSKPLSRFYDRKKECYTCKFNKKCCGYDKTFILKNG